MAAVLAGGEGAVLSHRSAAALWGVRFAHGSRIEVTAPCRPRSRSVLQFHVARLPSDEVTVQRRIPVTTVPRTILDLAAVVDRHQVERAVNEAEVLRLFDALSLRDLIERYPRRAGVAALKAILAGAALGLAITRSELEERFLAFLEEARLPRPAMNVTLEVEGHRFEVDCVWHETRLIVELDGHATHATFASFESDRRRDRLLQAAGWRVVRVTWRQLHEDPAALAADLGRLIGG
jgi:very-short-patch-repair endonuclease